MHFRIIGAGFSSSSTDVHATQSSNQLYREHEPGANPGLKPWQELLLSDTFCASCLPDLNVVHGLTYQSVHPQMPKSLSGFVYLGLLTDTEAVILTNCANKQRDCVVTW